MPNGETGGPPLRLTPSTEVEAYFDQALELDPRERECLLAELAKQQPEIAQGVRILLAELQALNTAGFLLESPPCSAEKLLPVVVHVASGDRVGPYSLICEIGQGGMSSVCLAQRDDGQFKREVALKLPVLGPRMQLERFIRERDMLAALTHPNIARLYDAGVTASGQPYLAMEYVAGTTLTRSCDERQLALRERLSLFVQVLQTVQFAHAGLIIHRDLKPSNILVTPQGRVVLLDFGIGKLLTGDSTDETHLTQLAGRAFTPYYASPEQITGQPLGTASDIYSLGVILYELLTGNRPYRPTHESRAALEEDIIKADLRRPSQADISTDSAVARGTSPRSLARALAGDVDNIVLKALKKNPDDRYASASAFAQDVTNYLGSLPVSARPDNTWYRVSRFTVRHKIPVIGASVAATALLAGAALATWQARTASEAAVRYLERLTAVLTRAIPAGSPPWLTRALVQARLNMGRGQFDSAREQFTRALDNPNTSTGMAARLGRSEAELRRGDAIAAVDDARLALKTASATQGNLPYSENTGLSWMALGRAQLQLGHAADARQAFENAAAHLSNTVDDTHSALVEARELLANH
ncbi:MAG TPA: serine/threonine-protein kinase [Steroidobacteraceae bacterium]